MPTKTERPTGGDPAETPEAVYLRGLLDDTSPFPSEVRAMYQAAGIYSYEDLAHCLVVMKKRENRRKNERRGS
jgi:hypothetical protein